MRFISNKLGFVIAGVLILCAVSATDICAQSTYTGQLTGVVTDSSEGVIANAQVVLTDEATNVPTTETTNSRGIYVFTNVRPATYSIRVDATSFGPQEKKGVVVGVAQQATINFTLSIATATTTMLVTEQLPLLDTGNATLGTDVTNEYIHEIPLVDHSMFGLVFLAGGVTETTGSGIRDGYPSGTNFVSNGQRNATAEVRLDGALTSAPEQGEGSNTNVYYQPSTEAVQEFKVENNSFSAEYGNNGGTVLNFVMKEGGNKFHGSGWWFGQRSALDANSFFLNANNQPKPDQLQDQYGFSLGGPIKKGKTFFFVDLEKARSNSASIVSGTVPSLAERTGDFSNAPEPIFNPFQCNASGNPLVCTTDRSPFPGNKIDPSLFDPIGLALLKAYPLPTVPDGVNPNDLENYTASLLSHSTSRQFDIKVDHHFNDKRHISFRYSNLYAPSTTPFLIDGGSLDTTYVHNIGIEYNWALTPTTIWASHFALDRVREPVTSIIPTLQSVGFDATDPTKALENANGFRRMPTININGGDDEISMYTECCNDTNFAHTLYSYSSAVSFVRGAHTLKTGFEQRQFFNNFYQPQNPTGIFNFSQVLTAKSQNDTDPDPITGVTDGNPFAALLLGYGDPNSGSMLIMPSVANKSLDTAFYVQDDWKINSRLTVNLGLRYEWSTPYDERFNRQQYNDFTADTGQSVMLPLNLADSTQLTSVELTGTSLFPGQHGLGRHLPVDRNNLGPRFGFAWSMDQKTVVRGGAGIYYGLSPATNFQSAGPAFSASLPIQFSLTNTASRFATLENPFPTGLPVVEGQKYGGLALWGFGNASNLGTETARSAEIYQWNLGVQRLFPWQMMIGIDYSANHSTHLPWGGGNSTRNRNFISSAVRNQLVAQFEAGCNDGTGPCPSDILSQLVPNPFQRFFVQLPGQPAPLFNEPASQYNNDEIPWGNLLHPYPQFDGSFEGLPNLGASSWYHSMQVRFNKRASHYISFQGNYTFSKATDYSSIGANSFVGRLDRGNPQILDNLKLEHGIGANDATHRFVVAAIVELPIGRGRWIGRDMNRVLDGVIGGWVLSSLLTRQSGQPIAVLMNNSRLSDTTQRPNVLCPQLTTGISYHHAVATHQPFLNSACFGDPGDQVPGNAPRYFSNLRSDGIHNEDLSITKEFAIREKMKLEIRGEFFNFTNTPRFALPNVFVGAGSFGHITRTIGGARRTQISARFQF
jgi:carboxypeptidase family protein